MATKHVRIVMIKSDGYKLEENVGYEFGATIEGNTEIGRTNLQDEEIETIEVTNTKTGVKETYELVGDDFYKVEKVAAKAVGRVTPATTKSEIKGETKMFKKGSMAKIFGDTFDFGEIGDGVRLTLQGKVAVDAGKYIAA